MSFVANSLIPGEEVTYPAQVTWMSQAIWFILAVITIFTFILPALFILIAVLNVMTTELALTNKKVVGKTGWIGRTSVDLPLQKVESITLKEGIFGRIFGYGTVVISGTGGHRVGIPNIKDPMAFRRAVMTAVDQQQQPAQRAA